MAFAVRNLSVLSYANGFTLWHYKAADPLHAVEAPGYFGDAGDMLAQGDMMMLSAADGARIVCVSASGDDVRTAALA